MVNLVSGANGPFDSQRELFATVVASLDQFVSMARGFLDANEESCLLVRNRTLAICALVLDSPAESEKGEFTIELSDPDRHAADMMLGVNFSDGRPKDWYMDH